MIMSNNDDDDQVRALLRSHLNKDGIKLWLPPYTLEDGQSADIPEELIQKYSALTNLSRELVASTLENLRNHANQKLASRNKFLKTGVANLKVKLAGNISPQMPNNVFTLDFELHVSVGEFRKKIAQHCNIEASKLKLIACGHVLEMNKSLSEQNVKHNSQIMAILLTKTEAEAQAYHEQLKLLEATRQAAEILSTTSDDSDEFALDIADQFGNPIKLPLEEKKALALAMTLNEKGRTLFKKKAYGEALVLFLEADREFSKCSSDILKMVDNYAVLCLDITWCYLCLKSVNDLPDAVQRLKTCEECFSKSYGENMERLKAVKGHTTNTQVLYVRLNLLKGILAYYHNKKAEALAYLEKAENILKPLYIEDEKLIQVVALGYTPAEARLGLRESNGNCELAVDYIIRRKEEKEALRRKLREDRHLKNEQKKLGKTVYGDEVNMEFYRKLLSMGYGHEGAKASLQQSNNNLSLAIQLLHEIPHLSSLHESSKDKINDAVIQQLASLGFNLDIAKRVLEHFKGDMEKSLNSLLASHGALPDDVPSSSSSSDSSPSSSASSCDEIVAKQKAERRKLEEEAFRSLQDIIPEDEDDYLDITLEDEATFIYEYKILLEKSL